MLYRRSKPRPTQQQVEKLLLATARLLLESQSYKVPLTQSNARQPRFKSTAIDKRPGQ